MQRTRQKYLQKRLKVKTFGKTHRVYTMKLERRAPVERANQLRRVK